MKMILTSVALVFAFYSNLPAQQAAPGPTPTSIVRAEKYYRTELYMGMSIPGGGKVSEDSWESFLTEVVTPLFPDGFTVLGGRGQYREASGIIAKEASHVLVFLYRKHERKTAGSSIEKIRAEYKKRFVQESVLRVDVTTSVLVRF